MLIVFLPFFFLGSDRFIARSVILVSPDRLRALYLPTLGLVFFGFAIDGLSHALESQCVEHASVRGRVKK